MVTAVLATLHETTQLLRVSLPPVESHERKVQDRYRSPHVLAVIGVPPNTPLRELGPEIIDTYKQKVSTDAPAAVTAHFRPRQCLPDRGGHHFPSKGETIDSISYMGAAESF